MVNMKSNPRLKLNPAFQAAQMKSKNNPWNEIESQLMSATSGDEKVNYEIANARKTGKLFLSNAGLTSLPGVMFDIRSDLLDKYTGNIDESNELRVHEKAWLCYGEEMLTVVCFVIIILLLVIFCF